MNEPHPPADAGEFDPFAGPELERVVPTTEAQREVWLATQLGREASLAYNESISLHLRGTLDTAALLRAIQDLSRRHQSLRATVSADGLELLIAQTAALPLTVHDLSALEPTDRAAALEHHLAAEVESPFDLERGPLARARLLRLSADEHRLMLTVHHIVCDGWSFGVLCRDLGRLYGEGKGCTPVQTAPDAMGDYALAELADASSQEFATAERYWLSQYDAGVPTLELPTDHVRPSPRRFESRREDIQVTADLLARLKRCAGSQGASLFSVLLAGFAATLARLSNCRDLVVGVPSAGQSLRGMPQLVGHCVNLLPLRLQADPEQTGGELIARTQSAVLDGFENARYTFGTLLKKLRLPRDPARPALVSVMFNLDQPIDSRSLGFEGLAVDVFGNPRSFESFELFLNVTHSGDALRIECQYAASLFEQASVQVWLRSYVTLLEAMADRPETSLGRLQFTSPEDTERLRRWNATARVYPRDAALVDYLGLDDPAKAGHVALAAGELSLSYSQLDDRSSRLAYALAARGAGRGSLVGLHLTRGPDMVVGLLAVLKAGAAYVPLDPAFPDERLITMARDADLKLLVTAGELPGTWNWPADRTFRLDLEKLPLDQLPLDALPVGAAAHPEDPAYVIYTSGSTGTPKGVIVPQRAVVNFLASMAREPGIQAACRLLAVTTLSFDIAVLELLLPLKAGATIVLASREQAMDGFALADLIDRHDVDMMQATPSTWRLLIESGWTGSRQFTALVGGEALPRDLAEQLCERTGALWNMYGPTETTVWSTCEKIQAPVDRISIGRPIANTTVLILDERREICPPGVPGEICIGGDGVTCGYHARPELTTDRFVPSPKSTGNAERIYRTGDRGRWLHDGRLEHQGRFDFQVKIRGYRIELGEVESALAVQPSVSRVVALAREDRPGDVRLVAYVVPEGRPPEASALREALRRLLPDYMIPQHFVMLDVLPLLPNGKIDRKALPAPIAAERAHSAIKTESGGAKIDAVSAAFEKALNLPGVGPDDDFFSLGGHSLLAAQLVAGLSRQFGRQIPLRVVFEQPTVRGVAHWLDTQLAAAGPAMRITHVPGRSVAPLSLMQQRIWFLEQLQPGRSAYNVPSGHRLTGPLDPAAFAAALDALIRRQPALRTVIGVQDDEPVQRVVAPFSLPLLPPEDLSSLPAVERELRLAERLRELALQVFDLERGPLVTAHLFRLAPEEHVFFFMAHHLVWDGWSFDILYRDLGALYARAIDQSVPAPPELEVSYGDFAVWQRDFMRGDALQAQVEHWRGRLADAGAVLMLPEDSPRPLVQSGRGSSAWINLDRTSTAAVHDLARNSETTPFVVLLSAFVATLHALTGQRDFVVGSPVRGRSLPELESVMGFFVNALPIRIGLEPGASMAHLLQTTRTAVRDAFSHPDVPFEHLVRALDLPRDESRFPLYQSFFSYQDGRDRPRNWGPLQHRPNFVERAVATEDLGLWFLEREDGLRGGLIVNADILSAASAAHIGRLYAATLQRLMRHPGASLEQTIAATLEEVTAPVAWLAHRERVAAQQTTSPPPASRTPAQPPSGARRAPDTAAERVLASIWSELLGVEEISTTDNFFDLGGHSLLAMKAIVEMDRRLGKRVNPRRYIFESLAQIAAAPDERPAPPRGVLGRVLSALRRDPAGRAADRERRG